MDILRTGAWLTRERVRLVVFGLLAASLIAVVYVVATSDGLNDRFGRPLGTDFSNVYAAGTYVLDGNAAAPSIRRGNTRASRRSSAPTRRSTAGTIRRISSASRRCLRRCPMGWRWRFGRASTFALYLWVDRAILQHVARDHARSPTRYGFCSPSPFPAVFVNLGHGHNGFLTAALFGAALLQLDRRPFLPACCSAASPTSRNSD